MRMLKNCEFKKVGVLKILLYKTQTKKRPFCKNGEFTKTDLEKMVTIKWEICMIKYILFE